MPSYDLSAFGGGRGRTIYPDLIAHVSGVGGPVYPHHPIQCPDVSTWDMDDDGMACKHAAVPIMDEKLQASIQYSIATLIIELGSKL